MRRMAILARAAFWLQLHSRRLLSLSDTVSLQTFFDPDALQPEMPYTAVNISNMPSGSFARRLVHLLMISYSSFGHGTLYETAIAFQQPQLGISWQKASKV